MTARQPKPSTPLSRAAVRIFAANERLNQLLISNLDASIWNAQPPGKVRPIAAIFTHIHNVRTKWIRLSAPHLKVPAQINRAHATQRQTSVALARSAAACAAVLAEALSSPESRTKKFYRDSWGSPWPAGPEMLAYMVAHEAHHRGQICMLAHQLGSPLPNQLTSHMWNWEKLWRECGAPRGPGHDS